MALPTTFSGLSSFMYKKLHHVCSPNKLVWSRSFGKGDLKMPLVTVGVKLGVKKEDSDDTLNGESIVLEEETLEKELRNAVAEENYAEAAIIRDTLKNLRKDSKTAILRVNKRFCVALSTGDLAAMQNLWAKKDEVCCVYPNLKGITGYADIIESWNYILVNHNLPLKIILDDIKVHVIGNMGFLTCKQLVKTNGGGRWGEQFVTNVFEKIDGQWFIRIHHASSVPQQ